MKYMMLAALVATAASAQVEMKFDLPPPTWRGVTITPADGKSPTAAPFVHDGYVFAADRGRSVARNHIDFFTGFSDLPVPTFITSTQQGVFTAYIVHDPAIRDAMLAAHRLH